MSEYTAEQAEHCALTYEDCYDSDVINMLRSYAALLREREEAKAGVTFDSINAAMLAYNTACHSMGDMSSANYTGIRAALEAAAPMLASARVPDGMIERIDSAIQRITDGHAPRRIPADPTDVDLVLAEVRSWLTGQGWPPFWIAAAPKPETEG